jgi:diacylglycerol kinase (ATP)
MAQTLLLLAAAANNRLLDWLDRHHATLAGLELLANGELAQELAGRPALAPLLAEDSAQLGSLAAGADIRAAALALDGRAAAVMAFADPHAPAALQPDLALLARACAVADIPLALNPASADLALRGLLRSRRAYLLFNPVAGNGAADATLLRIRSLLEPQLQLEVMLTQAHGDPAEQTRGLIETIRTRHPNQASEANQACEVMVVACGGDGTVSAVAGALVGTDIPLGVIPCGTANAFAAALAIPTDLAAACAVLLAGLGFEAGMVNRTNRELKTRFGALAYVLAGAQQLLSQQPFSARLTIDGSTQELEAAAITVANVAPNTSVLAQGFGAVVPDDGLLEVTVATPTSRLQGLNALAALMTSAVVQTPSSHPDLLCLRAREIQIATDTPQQLVVDGEMVTASRVTIRSCPGALRVITPVG